jgi:uncharacterized membrane-anchored protein
VGAILGLLLVGFLGTIVAFATPVRASALTTASLLAAVVGAWLGARRARRRAART